MCLILVANDCYAGYRLIVAANRDEFHSRATAPAERWTDRPTIVAGRDLESGGTWLGVENSGRFAALTNVRDEQTGSQKPRSRGLIVVDFLMSSSSAIEFCTDLALRDDKYNGFNLLSHDGKNLCWHSNQIKEPYPLQAGVHTLSNARLETQWPKTQRLKEGFIQIMDDGDNVIQALLDLLGDATHDTQLASAEAKTSNHRESHLSSIFIRGEHYGTRCSTVLTVKDDNTINLIERRYDADTNCTGTSNFILKQDS